MPEGREAGLAPPKAGAVGSGVFRQQPSYSRSAVAKARL